MQINAVKINTEMPSEKWGQSLCTNGKGKRIIRKMRTECTFKKKMVMAVQPHPARVTVLYGC